MNQSEEERDLKLPVRMSIIEFSALVELIRMHKKKFRVLEKRYSKKKHISSVNTSHNLNHGGGP